MADTQGFSFRLGTGPSVGFLGDPDYFFIGTDNSATVRQVNLVDNIFEFFPNFAAYIRDDTGTFLSQFPFIESLNMQLSINDDVNNLSVKHNYYWTDFQLPKMGSLVDHLTGQHYWAGISKFKKDDTVNSKSFGTNSSQAIGVRMRDGVIIPLAEKYFDDDHIFVDKGLENVGIYYQANDTDFEFIRKLSKLASSDTSSPYLTFINSAGEFYFDTVYNLMSQTVKDSLKVRIEPSNFQQYETDQIQNYNLVFNGARMNEQNYNKNVYALNSDGTFDLRTQTIKTYFQPAQIKSNEIGATGGQKLMVRNQYTGGLRDVEYFGLIDNALQQRDYKGWRAWTNIESLLAYRTKIGIQFNSDAIAGRTIQLSFKDGAGSDQISQLYAGKWLIYQSNHQFNNNKRRAFTILSLVRSGLEVPNKQEPLSKIYSDF